MKHIILLTDSFAPSNCRVVKILPCLLAAAVLLAGCTKPAAVLPDAKTAALQTRVFLLESNVADLYDRNQLRIAQITNLWHSEDLMLDLMKTNESDYFTRALLLEIQVAEQAAALSNLIVALNSRSLPKTAPLAAAAAPGRMPAAVEQQIRAAAAQKWPADFEMQAFELKNQTAAWYKLNE